MQSDLNRHWQIRLHVGEPGFIAYARASLATVAMLCIAGPQAAFVLAALFLAARGQATARRTAGGLLLVGPNGFFRFWRNAMPFSADPADPAHSGATRILKNFWQGPCWLTLSLQDPYFPHMPADTVTVWSIGQPPDVWRRFRALVLSARWADTRSTGGRVAI